MNRSIKPILIDFSKIRTDRQIINNNKVLWSIHNMDKTEFNKNVNLKQLDRILDYLCIDIEGFFENCKNNEMFTKLSSCALSKNSTRQGSSDEKLQLSVCRQVSSLFGIEIKNLSSVEFRPTKDGRILSNEQIKRFNIPKNQCLKSFDGMLCGRMTGYIFCKVLYGIGGHQDNVFEEIDTISKWWSEYKKSKDDYLVVLIDTDHVNNISIFKEKYKDFCNILYLNHYEFQEYMIKNFESTILK